MSGIVKQVGKYKAAANGRNMKSAASKEAMTSAMDVSRGVGRHSNSGRASWEGYQHAPSTLIAANGRGYDSTMKARRNPKRPTNFGSANATTLETHNNRYSNIVDYRTKGSKGSASDLLSKRKEVDWKNR